MLNINEVSQLQVGVLPLIQGGRISAPSDTTLSWLPYYHGSVGLNKGNSWTLVTCTGVSISNTSMDIEGNNLVANKNYDVFARYNGAVDNFVLELSPWSSDNGRKYALTRRSGVWSFDSSDPTKYIRRFIGSVRPVASGVGVKFIDTPYQRYVVNWDNRIPNVVVATNTNPNSFSLTSTQGTMASVDTSAYEVKGEFLNMDPTLWAEGHASIVRLGGTTARMDFGVTINGQSLLDYSAQDPNDSYAHGYQYFVPVHGNTLLGYNYITLCYRNWGATTVTTSGGTLGGAVLTVMV
jgi:hypothetical protein